MVLLYGCASSGQITGGPKDTKPPVLIAEQSSPPMQLNTKERKFFFTFNEYVEVKDVLKEVLVSPPLVYLPKVFARAKKVTFEFNEKEVLKDSTTYIISFGESIRDFNEGNKFSNFKHVFSTGGNIDSLQIKGAVFELESNKPAAGIAVLLYEDLSDSIIIKKKPFYATKTDKEGKFSLENLKKSKFRILAIKDENGNLTYNESNELIGFVDQYVQWDTSIVLTQNLYISLAELNPRIVGSNNSAYGIYRAKLNTKLNLIPQYTLNTPIDFHHLEMKEDSLLLHYYNQTKIDSFNWILPFDTVKIYVKDTATAKLKLTGTPKFQSIGHLPTDSLFFQFNSPIGAIDASKIIFGDTVSVKPVKASKKDFNTLAVVTDMDAKKSYNYTILPGAITDLYGNVNDSITGKVSTYDMSQLSKIAITIEGLDSTATYVVTLMKSNQEIKNQIVQNQKTVTLKYNNLKSDEYTLAILEDKNNNGVKDASNYWKKRQAEKIHTFKLEKLRETWELETKIDYTTKQIK